MKIERNQPKARVKREQAARLAANIVARLAPACDRIEIAGSIRRADKAHVGDIEICAIPKIGPRPDKGLFSEPGSLLEPVLDQAVADHKLSRVFAGDRACRYQVTTAPWPIMLDLFITTPEAWGFIFAIRTGPADYSKWLVTAASKGGGLAPNYRCRDGAVWRVVSGWNHPAGKVCDIDGVPHVQHPVPEESDFFSLIEGGYVPPERRSQWKTRNARD